MKNLISLVTIDNHIQRYHIVTRKKFVLAGKDDSGTLVWWTQGLENWNVHGMLYSNQTIIELSATVVSLFPPPSGPHTPPLLSPFLFSLICACVYKLWVRPYMTPLFLLELGGLKIN